MHGFSRNQVKPHSLKPRKSPLIAILSLEHHLPRSFQLKSSIVACPPVCAIYFTCLHPHRRRTNFVPSMLLTLPQGCEQRFCGLAGVCIERCWSRAIRLDLSKGMCTQAVRMHHTYIFVQHLPFPALLCHSIITLSLGSSILLLCHTKYPAAIALLLRWHDGLFPCSSAAAS